MSRTVVEPSEEELLAGTPLRAVADVEVTHEAANTEEVTTRPRRVKPPVATPTPSPELLEDDPTATDVVNDIFARLRASTLEERGASERAKPTVRQKTNAPDDAVFGRRDDAIEEALALTIKRVKRALQDDQNSVLEALRDVGGLITTELGDEAEQRARFATAIDEGLRACALAGARFAKAEGAASDQPPSESALSDVAADFSYQIVNALRRKILTEGGGSATERANEAYREWRGARVERLCTQEARRAFHLGVVAACASGNVLFLAAPYDTPCDACDMDAKAGPRPAGTAFPSGTPFPPGHAGCACTIVPA
jgi:hypothetical protein